MYCLYLHTLLTILGLKMVPFPMSKIMLIDKLIRIFQSSLWATLIAEVPMPP